MGARSLPDCPLGNRRPWALSRHAWELWHHAPCVALPPLLPDSSALLRRAPCAPCTPLPRLLVLSPHGVTLPCDGRAPASWLTRWPGMPGRFLQVLACSAGDRPWRILHPPAAIVPCVMRQLPPLCAAVAVSFPLSRVLLRRSTDSVLDGPRLADRRTCRPSLPLARTPRPKSTTLVGLLW